MSEPIVITLAGVPIGKGRPRFSRKSGHAYTPERTRTYENSLAYIAQAAMYGREIFEGPLSVSVLAVFPVPASWSNKRRAQALDGLIQPTCKPDADNLLKVLDALNEIVWRDDKQIVLASILKQYGKKASYQVIIRELT